MFPVLVTLAVAVFGVVVLAVFATASVLAEDERTHLRRSQQWQPPLAEGSKLTDWAKNVARMIVADELKAPPTGRLPVRLIRQLYQGFGRTLRHIGTFAAGERPAPCASEPAATFGVTAVEALAVAEHIRGNCDDRTRQEIQRQLAENRLQLESASVTNGCKVKCPLLAADGICAAFELRPLHCRTCSSCTMKGGVFHPSQSDERLAADLEQGLSTALAAEGLDGQVYEFNSALEIALGTPRAAECWAKGEPVFNQCRPIHTGPTS